MADSRPEQDLFEAVRAYVRAVYGPGCRPLEVRVPLSDGGRVWLSVPAPWQQDTAKGPKHSKDFRSVNWFGSSYTFTAAQAAAVKLLWEAWEEGVPELSQETLLEASGSEANKLADVFRDHPAWNSLIVAGSSRGAYRLAEPG